MKKCGWNFFNPSYVCCILGKVTCLSDRRNTNFCIYLTSVCFVTICIANGLSFWCYYNRALYPKETGNDSEDFGILGTMKEKSVKFYFALWFIQHDTMFKWKKNIRQLMPLTGHPVNNWTTDKWRSFKFFS